MFGSLDLALRELEANNNGVVGGGSKVDDSNLTKSKKLKNTKSRIQTRVGVMEELIFLILSTKKVFKQLRQAFTKAPILQNFDLKCHI